MVKYIERLKTKLELTGFIRAQGNILEQRHIPVLHFPFTQSGTRAEKRATHGNRGHKFGDIVSRSSHRVINTANCI